MSTTTKKCCYCNKVFSKTSNYKRHLKNVHKRDDKGEIITETEETPKFTCEFCEKEFVSKRSVQRHTEAFHSVDTPKIYECDLCNFRTLHYSNLLRHILILHKNKKESNANFKCSLCIAKYKHEKNLRFHERKYHGIGKVCFSSERKCPICKFTTSKRNKDMYNHFENVHDISIKSEHLNFNSMAEFFGWKLEIEQKTVSYFSKKYSFSDTVTYRCHRCGFYKKKGTNKRRMKTIGTCKVNGFCPAMMQVKTNEKNINVLYISTHVGHENELEHLPLMMNDRVKIANQLASNTPHKEILTSIKSSLSNCGPQRIHLVKKKDLLNIEKSLNLKKEPPKYSYDPVSVEDWVNELKISKKTALLVYKPQKVLSDAFPELKEEDFVLIVMSEAQKTILNQYSRDIVCVDRTLGFNSCKFQLYTLLTMGETREGFPAAFMFTNRRDEIILEVFFDQIKEVLGCIESNVFMSNIEDTYYTAWIKTMGPSTNRIYCTWHVFKTWRKNINNMIKIKVKREYVFKMLENLLYELDEATFKTMLQETLKQLSDDKDTNLFYNYFKDQYVNGEQYICWAYCFRINAGISTNMSIENFNKVLKCCYLKGKQALHVRKTLNTVLNVFKDEIFDLIIKIENQKLEQKFKLLRSRHNASLLLDSDNIVTPLGDKWQILSSTQTKSYTVKRLRQRCTSCQLQCLHCNSCFHEFVCSCADNAIQNNMCEHIHLICRTQIDNISSNIYEETHEEPNTIFFVHIPEEMVISQDLVIPDIQEDMIVEEVIVHKVSVNEDQVISFNRQKSKLLEEFNEIEKYLTTVEQVEYVRSCISEIIPTLETMHSPLENL